MSQTKAPQTTPSPQSKASSLSGEKPKSPTSVFVTMALDMSWRLAIVVILPIIAGFKLDERFESTPAFIITGFVLAIAGTALVMWRTLQVAGQQPVPKKENK